jgi:hypothetical protein
MHIVLAAAILASAGVGEGSHYLDRHSGYSLLALYGGDGCQKDTDCKGDRVCNAGVCIDAQRVPGAAQSRPTTSMESAALRISILDNQITQLNLSKMPLVGPVTSIVAGGVLTAGGILMFFVSGFPVVTGVIVMVSGIACLITGIVMTVVLSNKNEDVDKQVRALEGERDRLRSDRPGDDPGRRSNLVLPMTTVARF